MTNDIISNSKCQPNESIIRNWLQKNKIFFETITAALLSLMAIIVAVVHIGIANKQTKLSEIQTQIAQRQFEREESLAKVAKTAKWGELRNAMWEIFDLFPLSGTNTLKSLSQENQLLFFKKIREILDSQIDNSVLIENRKCLGHWRAAISGAKSMAAILDSVDATTLQHIVIANANGILNHISFVWQKLILASDEVAAVGGNLEED